MSLFSTGLMALQIGNHLNSAVVINAVLAQFWCERLVATLRSVYCLSFLCYFRRVKRQSPTSFDNPPNRMRDATPRRRLPASLPTAVESHCVNCEGCAHHLAVLLIRCTYKCLWSNDAKEGIVKSGASGGGPLADLVMCITGHEISGHRP